MIHTKVLDLHKVYTGCHLHFIRMATFEVIGNVHLYYNVYGKWECYCTEQNMIYTLRVPSSGI
jgi:hypothetical protein